MMATLSLFMTKTYLLGRDILVTDFPVADGGQKVLTQSVFHDHHYRSTSGMIGIDGPTLQVWQHLYQCQVVAVICRRRVVNGYSRPTERSCSILPLHPEGIEPRYQKLMDQGLVCTDRSCRRPVPVITYTEHPGIVACGNQA